MEHRSEHRQTVPSVERGTDPSPNVRATEKLRTEVKQAAHAENRRSDPSPNVKIVEKSRTDVAPNAKAVAKATPEKASTATVRPKDERDVQKVSYTTERGDANESRERGVRRDGSTRL
jgi:hypothetical protein